MKRLFPVLLVLIFLFGCSDGVPNAYRHAAFTASIPEPFEPVDSVSIVCFAPYGDPLLSSSITYSSTESNWYFDSFTTNEYAHELKTLCGYEELSLEQVETKRIDGYDARRIACKVHIDQGTHDLILYAVNAYQTYIFTLLNREGDDYISAFDEMMSALDLTEVP